MVHFVGAGSGAKDLITVRGMNLLKNADVIIYAGSLVNPELLEYAEDSCEIYNSAYMTLEEIIDVIKTADSENKDYYEENYEKYENNNLIRSYGRNDVQYEKLS